jgi:two-component system response regulator RegA
MTYDRRPRVVGQKFFKRPPGWAFDGARLSFVAGTRLAHSANAMADDAHTLVIADDDTITRQSLASFFKRCGWRVTLAANAAECMERLGNSVPTHAVVEERLPDRSGTGLLQELKGRNPDVVVVILTRYGSVAGAVRAMRGGAANYLAKPVDAAQVAEALNLDLAPRPEEAPFDMTDRSPASLARVEWEHINRVLVNCEGNVSEAARMLGLHRRSLQRKLVRFAPSR